MSFVCSQHFSYEFFFDNLCNCAKTHFLIGMGQCVNFNKIFTAPRALLLRVDCFVRVTQCNLRR